MRPEVFLDVAMAIEAHRNSIVYSCHRIQEAVTGSAWDPSVSCEEVKFFEDIYMEDAHHQPDSDDWWASCYGTDTDDTGRIVALLLAYEIYMEEHGHA